MSKRTPAKAPPIPAQGWPCHSFIREPIYRKITLGRDVRLTDKGMTLRVSEKGKHYFIKLTWKEIAEKALLLPRWRKKDI